MHYVTDRLLVGNAEEAQQPPSFVSAVLYVAGDFAIDPPAGVEFSRIPLTEFSVAAPEAVLAGVDWLEQREPSDRLLVCCRAGIGRSVSIVIAYLCCVEGMAYPEALDLLKARRPGATPLPNLEQTIEAVRRMREARDGTGHETE